MGTYRTQRWPRFCPHCSPNLHWKMASLSDCHYSIQLYFFQTFSNTKHIYSIKSLLWIVPSGLRGTSVKTVNWRGEVPNFPPHIWAVWPSYLQIKYCNNVLLLKRKPGKHICISTFSCKFPYFHTMGNLHNLIPQNITKPEPSVINMIQSSFCWHQNIHLLYYRMFSNLTSPNLHACWQTPQWQHLQIHNLSKLEDCIYMELMKTVLHTLQLKMFPNAENVSYMALLSILLSKFFMKTLPTPDLRSDGSRWDHMMRIGRPFIMSKFMVSRARSAKTYKLV